jgi:hypothetical protein
LDQGIHTFLEIGRVHRPTTSIIGAESIKAIHVILSIDRLVGLELSFDAVRSTQEDLMRSGASRGTCD